MLSSSLVRWNRLSSPCNSSTEDQPVSTQEGAAPPEHQETSDQPDDAYTHNSKYIHAQPLYAYTPLLMHTHNPRMHTHHSICTHTIHIHIHTTQYVCTHTNLHMHSQAYIHQYTHNYTIPYAHTTLYLRQLMEGNTTITKCKG